MCWCLKVADDTISPQESAYGSDVLIARLSVLLNVYISVIRI